jgi:hypothetical protein
VVLLAASPLAYGLWSGVRAYHVKSILDRSQQLLSKTQTCGPTVEGLMAHTREQVPYKPCVAKPTAFQIDLQPTVKLRSIEMPVEGHASIGFAEVSGSSHLTQKIYRRSSVVVRVVASDGRSINTFWFSNEPMERDIVVSQILFWLLVATAWVTVLKLQSSTKALPMPTDSTFRYLLHDIRKPLAEAFQMVGSPQGFDSMQSSVRLRLEEIDLSLQGVEASRNVLSVHEELNGILRSASTRDVECFLAVSQDVWVWMSFSSFQRIFQNILSNACEAMEFCERKQIEIHVDLAAPFIKISVLNSGPKISHEFQKKLFQKGATQGKQDGRGYGLASVQHLVSSEGGAVWYVEEHCLVGFCITLPALSLANPKRALRLLAIEDSPIFLAALHKAPYTSVRSFSNASSFLKEMKVRDLHQYDAVLLDEFIGGETLLGDSMLMGMLKRSDVPVFVWSSAADGPGPFVRLPKDVDQALFVVRSLLEKNSPKKGLA